MDQIGRKTLQEQTQEYRAIPILHPATREIRKCHDMAQNAGCALRDDRDATLMR
jgi:hypothetical protein